MGEAKRKTALGYAVRRAVQPQAEDVLETESRRDRIKDELRRLIDVVDDGRFECMIVSELVDNNGTPKVMTNMIGELHQIQAAASNVVLHYSEKKGLRQASKNGQVPFMVQGA